MQQIFYIRKSQNQGEAKIVFYSSVINRVAPDLIFSNPAGAGFGTADPAGAGAGAEYS